MDYLQNSVAENHEYFDGAVKVREFNFSDNTINDAEITLTGRYPLEGYAVNDISTALITVESGQGEITIKEQGTQSLKTGDRLLIKSREPYFFHAMGSLVIRYIATPAWKPEQSKIVED